MRAEAKKKLLREWVKEHPNCSMCPDGKTSVKLWLTDWSMHIPVCRKCWLTKGGKARSGCGWTDSVGNYHKVGCDCGWCDHKNGAKQASTEEQLAATKQNT